MVFPSFKLHNILALYANFIANGVGCAMSNSESLELNKILFQGTMYIDTKESEQLMDSLKVIFPHNPGAAMYALKGRQFICDIVKFIGDYIFMYGNIIKKLLTMVPNHEFDLEVKYKRMVFVLLKVALLGVHDDNLTTRINNAIALMKIFADDVIKSAAKINSQANDEFKNYLSLYDRILCIDEVYDVPPPPPPRAPPIEEFGHLPNGKPVPEVAHGNARQSYVTVLMKTPHAASADAKEVEITANDDEITANDDESTADDDQITADDDQITADGKEVETIEDDAYIADQVNIPMLVQGMQDSGIIDADKINPMIKYLESSLGKAPSSQYSSQSSVSSKDNLQFMHEHHQFYGHLPQPQFYGHHPPPQSYGPQLPPQSYGPQLPPQSYGPQSYGPQSYGPQSYGPQPFGYPPYWFPHQPNENYEHQPFGIPHQISSTKDIKAFQFNGQLFFPINPVYK